MALISVLAELDRMGWEYQSASEDEVKVKCPFHQDDRASCAINVQKCVFKCYAGSCGASGDFISFVARACNASRAVVSADLDKRYGLEQVKIIEPDVIEKAHAEIWSHKVFLKELYLRGVTDADVRKHRLGVARNRITIPIKNDAGAYVNLRYYLPGAPAADKMRNSKGRGRIRLFPVEQLEHDTIVVCGGEIKAIVAARVLNQHSVGAVSATGGEGNWHHELTTRFIGKRVYILMDVDKAGVDASVKLAAILRVVAQWVGIVVLPLDIDKYPHGDVNDFVAAENGDLWKLVQETPQWTPPNEVAQVDEEPREIRFHETSQAQNVGKRIRFSGVVSAASELSYVVPKRIVVTCKKDQDCCAMCAVFPKDDKVFHVAPESPAILEMIGATKVHLDGAIRNAIGVPKRCAAVDFNIANHFNAEDIRINPSLEITNRDTERTMQAAVCVECDAELNTTYEFVGRLYPDPKTQKATLILSKSKTTHDALSKYTPQRLPDLRVFRPEVWNLEAVKARMNDIYDDLEANVSRIFMRRDIHLMIDLAYHSGLLITVDGKTTKGWVETLIVGDSAQGKTEAAMTLMQHYQLGEKVECKNASVAGLLGGLRQLGTQWFVSWGVIPTHDRRLVLLEELKGASREIIARLTDMRSSGRAEIPKIEKRRTHARTRLIANSNPREERTMSTFNFGVEAIRDLIGAPEDVRRFDAALIVSAEDIDPREVNALVRNPPKVAHRYTSDLCRELILWAWTRTQEQIVIEESTAEYISQSASTLCEEFTDQIPLIDRGSTRHKLSRLAVAVAARTFSTGNTELELLVRPCHAEFVVDTLRRVYTARSFGYSYFSEAVKTTTKMIDANVIGAYMQQIPHAEEVRKQLLYNDSIDLTDAQDWTGYDRVNAQEFISLLVRKRAVRRDESGRKYLKTPEFIEFLKKLTIAPRPAHIKGEEKF